MWRASRRLYAQSAKWIHPKKRGKRMSDININKLLGERTLKSVGTIPARLRSSLWDDPSEKPIKILIAEPEPLEAARAMIRQETLAGRFAYFYDLSHCKTAAAIEPDDLEKKLKRKGIHYIYKPHLDSHNILLETQSRDYWGLRLRSKEVSRNTQSVVDIRVGTGVRNFALKMKDKTMGGIPYVLMNTAGQNVIETAEWAQQLAMDAFLPSYGIHTAANDIVQGELRLADDEVPLRAVSVYDIPLNDSDMMAIDVGDDVVDEVEQEHTHNDKTSTFYTLNGGLAGKNVTVLGMGLVGCEVARRMKAQHCHVTGWGYTRPDNTESFSEQDAAILGCTHATSVSEAVANADIIFVHVKTSEAVLGSEELMLLGENKRKTVIINTAMGNAVDKDALDTALATNSQLIYYEDADLVHAAARPPSTDTSLAEEEEEAEEKEGHDVDETKKKKKKKPVSINAQVSHVEGPLKHALFLSLKYPAQVKVSPHWARVPECSIMNSMQAYNQISSLLWSKRITNAVNADFPQGFINAGQTLPANVGGVTAEAIAKVVATTDFKDLISTLAELSAEKHALDSIDQTDLSDEEKAKLDSTGLPRGNEAQIHELLCKITNAYSHLSSRKFVVSQEEEGVKQTTKTGPLDNPWEKEELYQKEPIRTEEENPETRNHIW